MASISGSPSSLLSRLENQEPNTEVKVETAWSKQNSSYVGKTGGSAFLEGASSPWGKFKAVFFPNQVKAARTAAFDQIRNEISQKYKDLPDFQKKALDDFDKSFQKGQAVLAYAVINFVSTQDDAFEAEKARQATPLASVANDATQVLAKGAAKVGSKIAKGATALSSVLYSMVSTGEDKEKLAATLETHTDSVRVDLAPDNFKGMSLSDTKKALGKIQDTLREVYTTHAGKSEKEIKAAFDAKVETWSPKARSGEVDMVSLFAEAMVRQTFKADSKSNWITKALGNIKDKKEGLLKLNIDNGAICRSTTGEAMLKALHVSDDDMDAMKQASADVKAQARTASQQAQQNIGRKWGVRE